jgi:hypothetical protein
VTVSKGGKEMKDIKVRALQFSRRHPLGRNLIAVFLTLWLLFWGFLSFIAPGLVSNAAQNWARGLGRSLSIAEVTIRPWSMSLQLDGVRLQDKDGSPMFSARRLQFEALPRSLLIGHWRARLLALDHAQLYLTRGPQGLWNWVRLAQDAAGPTSAHPGASATPKLWLDWLRISSAEIHVLDQQGKNPNRYDIAQFNFNLHDLSTLPTDGGYQLSAMMGRDTRLDWRGSLQLDPLVSFGHVRLSGFQLASVWNYVTPYMRLAPPRGTLLVDLDYQFNLKKAQPYLSLVSIYSRLDGMQLQSPDGQQHFNLQQLAFEDGVFDLQKHSLFFKRIRLSGGDFSAARDASGQLDWLAALPPPTPAASAQVSASAKAAGKRASAPGWKLQVNQLSLADWKLALTDNSFVQALQVNAALPQLSLALRQSPQHGLEIDQLGFNLQNLQLGAHAQAPVLSIDQTQLSGVALQDGKLHPGILTIKGPTLSLERGADGQINLQTLFKSRHPRHGSSASASPASLPPLPQFTLSDGKLNWSDRQPQRPVKLMLDQLSASLAPQSDGLHYAALLGGHLGRGQFKLSASLDPVRRSVQGQLNVDALPLAPLAPYALSGTILSLTQGNASARLDLNLTAQGWGLSGQAGIARLAVMEPGATLPLLGWNALSLSGIKVSDQPLALSVRSVLLDRPVARLVLDQHRVSNIKKLFSTAPGTVATSARPGGAGGATSAPAAAPAVPPATPADHANHGMAFNIRVVHVRNADVDFADQGLNPGFAAQINHLTGSISNLSSLPGQRGTLALNGSVDQGGDVRVSGVLAPLDITDSADITLMFRDIAMTSLNTYSENLAGWQISDGRLTVGLHYVLDHRKIQGENSVVVDSIQLGPEIERPGLSHLPLRLAIALLEDSHGRIELHLPVSGSLDDPQFSYSGLIWQAFVNVIEKAVTAPFRALAAMLGGQGFDDVRFVAGEAALAAPEQQKLQQLSQMMLQRPQLKLILAGTDDPDADRKQLARARIDQAILAAAGIELNADEPLPELDMQDAAVQSAVKTVYGQRVGRLKLLSRLMSTSRGSAFYAGLRQEAIAAEAISDAELSALAKARARSAQQFLLQGQPGLATRISLGAVHSAKASTDGVPLDIQLLTQ